MEDFISYISIEKAAVPSTVHKYRADLYRFKNFLLSNHQITNFSQVELSNIRSVICLTSPLPLNISQAPWQIRL